MRRLVLGLALTGLVACVGPTDPEPLPTPATSPPPPIPEFGAGPPTLDDCFPDVQGIPPFTPVPRDARLQGPDLYAAPYEPLGSAPRRVSGRGFSYEVSSRVSLVAGFHEACLDTYATEIDWQRLPTDTREVIFRIPLQAREPVIVVIADDPGGGPTVVVLFTEPRIAAAPSPTPSASETSASPGPAPSP